jgi:hypothetical protein
MHDTSDIDKLLEDEDETAQDESDLGALDDTGVNQIPEDLLSPEVIFPPGKDEES